MADCSLCHGLRQTPPLILHTKYAELKEAAAKGCELCDILVEVSKIQAQEWEDDQEPLGDLSDIHVSPPQDDEDALATLAVCKTMKAPRMSEPVNNWASKSLVGWRLRRDVSIA